MSTKALIGQARKLIAKRQRASVKIQYHVLQYNDVMPDIDRNKPFFTVRLSDPSAIH